MRARARLASAIVLGVTAVASLALADAPQGGSSPPPPPSQPAPAARASAVGQIAQEIARGLGTVPAGAVVVASPLASDLPALKAEDLAARIAAQIAGRLGVARAHPQPATLAAARGASGRAASLVYVQLEIAKGDLRATADLYPVVSNGWERLRNPAPGPQAHAFATAPIDAEVRTFLTPILLEQASVHRAKHDEGEVLAVGCGDVDGDGGLEVALVSRARVALGKLRAGRFAPIRTASWSQLASRVPVPMREPIATVLVSPRAHRGELLVGSTDRGGVAVDPTLVTKRQLTGIPVVGADGDACAIAVPEASVFDGHAIACAAPDKGDPKVVLQAPSPRYDAVAALELVGKDGAAAEVVAAREPGGRLRLRWQREADGARAIEAALEGVGAQVALADLDLDGQPEIATTSDAGEDAIAVATWSANGRLVPRLRLPAKDGVRALGACPPEAKGVPALVAVVGAEVWLVR